MAIRTVTDSVIPVDGPPGDVDRLEEACRALAVRHPGAVFRRYLDRVPKVADDAYVAAGTVVVGDVDVAAGASLWHGCVLRGDLAPIRVGEGSNVQDGAVVHVGDRDATVIGPEVVIGHGAVIHGATLERAVMVGIRAVLLDGVRVGAGSIVGAGAVVAAGTVVPPRSLVLGVPAKVRRSLGPDDEAFVAALAAKYRRLAHNHRNG